MYRVSRIICLVAFCIAALAMHTHFFYGDLKAQNNGLIATPGLKVVNVIEKPVFAATYCKNLITGNATRTSEVVLIPAKQAAFLPQPSHSFTCSRNLLFSESPEDLSEFVSKNSAQSIGSIGIGTTSGKILAYDYYITSQNGILKAFSEIATESGNTFTDTVLKTQAFLRTFYNTELQLALTKSRFYKSNPRDFEVAQVRISAQIPQEEAAFVQKRKQINKTALEKFLGTKLNGSYVPTIALVSSGGGARAFISSLGLHVGAEKTGLLDCVTYDVGLSGGSWFVGTWLQSQLTPSVFKTIMQPIMARGIDPTRGANFSIDEIQNILNGLMLRKAAQQPVTMVTLWGAMLANRYLSLYAPYSQDILFSQLYEQIADGRYPFPILAAVNGRYADLGVEHERAEWFEFTPLEAGGVGNWLGNAHIPAWALGRTFKNNSSIDTKPEYDLGQLMGICGSAFAFSMGRAFAETIAKVSMKFTYALTQALGEELVGTARVSVGKIPNFTQDVPGSIVKAYEDLRLVDAGMAFNIPIPPVIHANRKADIIIVMDASGKSLGGALLKAEKYARLHNLPFPKIQSTTLQTKALHIFAENQPDIPLVVHLSRAVDRENISYLSSISSDYSSQTSTLKFEYTPEEFNNLSGIAEANLAQNINQIKEAIIKKIKLHNGLTE